MPQRARAAVVLAAIAAALAAGPRAVAEQACGVAKCTAEAGPIGSQCGSAEMPRSSLFTIVVRTRDAGHATDGLAGLIPVAKRAITTRAAWMQQFRRRRVMQRLAGIARLRALS